jgi:peptidoglycan/LPS O-acetylase OafA/YrhL
VSAPSQSAPAGETLLRLLEIPFAPMIAGIVIFFAVAHLDRHSARKSLQSHARRAAPLYLLCLILTAIMISGWSKPGFGEFIDMYFIPFEIFFGGILGDAIFYLSPRRDDLL